MWEIEFYFNSHMDIKVLVSLIAIGILSLIFNEAKISPQGIFSHTLFITFLLQHIA